MVSCFLFVPIIEVAMNFCNEAEHLFCTVPAGQDLGLLCVWVTLAKFYESVETYFSYIYDNWVIVLVTHVKL
jgi:hypothetical protein